MSAQNEEPNPSFPSEEHRGREQELAEANRTLEQRLAEHARALVECHEQIRALAAELSLTEQRERQRIGTELHDHLAERLALARIKLAQLKQQAVLDTPSEQLLQEANTVLSRALAFTRTLVADLSPLVLQDLGMPAALKWMAERMHQYGLDVTVHTAVTEPPKLSDAVAAFLFQAVRELLINTLRHGKCRGAVLHLTASGGQLRIVVEDDGEGFEAATMESFTGGTSGLGVIRERIQAFGGTFALESSVGHGTKVTLTMPLEESAAADERAGPVPASGTNPAAGGIIRVLLVDDHAMVRQGLKSVLDAYPDMKVVGEAADGNAAVRMTAELLPTVVLMDINMPLCNGIEATRRIKARYPHIKIIGLSVDADGENQGAMLKAGAYSLLTKEAAVEQLYSLIYEAVKPGAMPFSPLR